MKTIILCGGLGTRLGNLTKLKPKPMILINSEPIIWHIIKSYVKHGFNEFILATGYKHKFIDKYFLKLNNKVKDSFKIIILKKNQKYKPNKNEISIKLAFTGKDTLTGGRLLKLNNELKLENNFMLTYGDGVSNINLKKLVKFHIKNNKIATVTAVNPPARFGALTISKNIVKKFREKVQTSEGWINGGFFVFNKKIFTFLKNDKTILEQEPMKKLVAIKQINAFKHRGFWHCIDTIRDKENLEEILKNRKLK